MKKYIQYSVNSISPHTCQWLCSFGYYGRVCLSKSGIKLCAYVILASLRSPGFERKISREFRLFARYTSRLGIISVGKHYFAMTH